MYAGTLSYFAGLQAQYELSTFASKANISPMFQTDPTNPTQAVSTVKALQLANQQGQQIYKIDNTNIDTVLLKLKLSQTIKNDIQSSVNAGKYVITHTDNVSVPDWSGAGYAIIDPLTGNNAYMISGGENGGFAELINNIANAFFTLSALTGDILEVISRVAKVLEEVLKVFAKVSGYLNISNFVLDLMNIFSQCNNYVGSILVLQLSLLTFLQTVLVDVLFFFFPGIGMIAGIILVAILNYAIGSLANRMKNELLPSCRA